MFGELKSEDITEKLAEIINEPTNYKNLSKFLKIFFKK